MRVLSRICLLYFVVLFAFHAPLSAQEQNPSSCFPEMLDVHLQAETGSDSQSDGHLLAIEVQNLTQQPCLLVNFDEGYQWIWNSDSALKYVYLPVHATLPAGATTHILIAWSSAPRHVDKDTLGDCLVVDKPPTRQFLQVRNLLIQTCGPFWVSAYRPGPYVPGEPIAPDWLEFVQRKPSDFPALRVPKSVSGSDVATLHALKEIDYLKQPSPSEYSYPQVMLRLSTPRLASPSCPYLSLRKREANGQTTVYLKHCSHGQSQPEAVGQAQYTAVRVSELGMGPETPRKVEYEVTTELLDRGQAVLTEASATTLVREPKEPELYAIDTSVPGCKSSQLKLQTAAVLGTHWAQPTLFAPPGGEWNDGSVFEVTNMSDRNCMIGGVPSIKGVKAPEENNPGVGAPLVAPCRNCATPLFKPRNLQWIELKPNDSAHFIVVRTLFGPAYGGYTLGGLDLTLPDDDQVIRLPFAIGFRNISESAWRTGHYDGDPMNVQYDREKNRLEKQREKQYAAVSMPVPAVCAKTMSQDTGTPLMLWHQGNLVLGLSTKTVAYEERLPVVLWVYNPSDKSESLSTCDLGGYWGEVYDADGHRLLSREEQKARDWNKNRKNKNSIMTFVPLCTRNFAINFPPHSCTHGEFSKPSGDFFVDLSTLYPLPPGRYFVMGPRTLKEASQSEGEKPDFSTALQVKVNEPENH